ncbi:hypothetical protein Q1695_004243 [Nippostrongylus brasiliensis]|nr:hypothetical protein Q1695_004243 [Nippostrongylus brasiliensis]
MRATDIPEHFQNVCFPNGKVIGKQWRIVKPLGAGSFGAVYKVVNINTSEMAALKVEGHREEGNAMKLEALKQLSKRDKMFAKVLGSGKKEHYSYVVMTLLGENLDKLIGKQQCTVSTIIRIGINVLYVIKLIHDMGFIHRDIKRGNMALGLDDRSRIIHILDFGLARQYVVFQKGHKPKMRRPRDIVHFRGSPRYASINALEKGEQGRDDDLWSLLYTLTEMRGDLPWQKNRLIKTILEAKRRTTPETLFKDCPAQFNDFYTHLMTLNYYSRPNYRLLYRLLENVRIVENIKYTDPFDWELSNTPRTSDEKDTTEQEGTSRAAIRTNSDSRVKMSSSTNVPESSGELSAPAPERAAATGNEQNPFPESLFCPNPLGF